MGFYNGRQGAVVRVQKNQLRIPPMSPDNCPLHPENSYKLYLLMSLFKD